MTKQNELQHSLNFGCLSKRALQGAGIALVLIIMFLVITGAIDEGLWIFLPMTTVTAGGAFGGIFYYLVNDLWSQTGWKRVAVNILCLLVYIFSLYFSLIAALNVTGHWD